MKRIAFLTETLLALSTTCVLARATETTIPGFAIDPNLRPIGVFDAYATLQNQNRVVFDGFDVNLVADDGTLITHLGSTPGFVFASFVAVDPTESTALIAESSGGWLYTVDLSVGGLVPVIAIDFSYDAVFEDATHVLVSAAPCGFNCGSEIYGIDLTTSAVTLVASLTGPSGPLALKASDGALYYVLQPSGAAPPGSHSVISWTAAQVAGGGLNAGNASTFAAGLNGGSSLRFDAVYEHLFVTESVFNAGTELIEFDHAGNQYAHVISSTDSLSNIEFLYGPGPGSFQAFQSAGGVTLRYRSTDFNAFTAAIVPVDPVRPVAAMSGPGLSGPGLVTFSVTGAHPLSELLVLVSPIAAYNPVETPYDTGTYLLWTGMPPDNIRRLVRVNTDALGAGSFTYNNPGNLQGTRVFQALITNPLGAFVGSSTTVPN